MAEELEAALPDDVCDLAERILGAAKGAEWQLATAESCTGGLLAALFTDVPGYSRVSIAASWPIRTRRNATCSAWPTIW
jgi:nicotinamide-nucleotide amidase